MLAVAFSWDDRALRQRENNGMLIRLELLKVKCEKANQELSKGLVLKRFELSIILLKANITFKCIMIFYFC